MPHPDTESRPARSPHRIHRLRRRTSIWAVVLLTVAAAPTEGQDTPRVRLVGEVREVTTERPIADIAVKLLELELVTVTDRNGFFMFDGIPPGEWTFEASGFGYRTNVEASHIGTRSLLVIRLEAAPLQLEGLYVSVVQRMVNRRMASPSRVIVWDREELGAAIAADIGQFVGRQGIVVFTPCGDEFTENDLPGCYIHRGRPRRLQLYVDDEPRMLAEGTSQLWAYDPRDLWTVEFLPGCGQLRVYTRRFMEWVEAGRVRLNPVLCIH